MIPFRPNVSTREIVFVRHAESQANADGMWNGRTDGPLSANGEASLEPLGKRLSNWHFDRVISSPLARTRLTAGSFSDDAELDEHFVELDMGEWEGRYADEVREELADELKIAVSDRTYKWGKTGESLSDLDHRATTAVDRLFHELEDGQRAAVVTHGGLLQAVLHRHMAGHGRRAHSFSLNTAITRIIRQFGRPRLTSFNDTAHLGPRSFLVGHALGEGRPVLALVRHGQTRANEQGRWQGQGDWGLNEEGLTQAGGLADWYGRWPTVYASPLRRASQTAEAVATNGVVHHDGLKEINMGKWDGMTTEEIDRTYPGELETVYQHGLDKRRGDTGESWAEMAQRFTNAIDDLDHPPGEPTVVVAHGGAIRSYISSLTKTRDTHSESFFTPANTSVTHVDLKSEGPEILDYSVAPHLERIR